MRWDGKGHHVYIHIDKWMDNMIRRQCTQTERIVYVENCTDMQTGIHNGKKHTYTIHTENTEENKRIQTYMQTNRHGGTASKKTRKARQSAGKAHTQKTHTRSRSSRTLHTHSGNVRQ